MDRRTTGPWRDAFAAALPAWLVARAVVLAALALTRFLEDEVRPGRAIVTRTVRDGLLAWDGTWYADIALRGYTALPDEGLRFFPGFPLLGRWLGIVVGDRVALVLVANVAALAAAVLLYRLVRWERGDAALATRAAWLLSVVPPAYVFVMGYTDALAVALAVGTFLAMRRGHWRAAAATAFVAGTMRPVGFLLAVPLALEAWSRRRELRGRALVPPALAVFAAPAGTAAYLAWVWREYGDPLLPYSVQTTRSLAGDLGNPLTTLWHAIEGGFDGRVGTALHVPWLVVFVALTVVVFRRWPLPYAAFTVLVVAAAVASENLDSLERYALFAFPLVLAGADLTASPQVERIVLALLPAGMFAYATLAFLGLLVP